MYLVELDYFAKPGLADQVFQIRAAASEAHAALRLPLGVVLRGPGGDFPDVVWRSGPYTDLMNIKESNKRLWADQRFLEAYRQMASLLRHFERRWYRIVLHAGGER